MPFLDAVRNRDYQRIYQRDYQRKKAAKRKETQDKMNEAIESARNDVPAPKTELDEVYEKGIALSKEVEQLKVDRGQHAQEIVTHNANHKGAAQLSAEEFRVQSDREAWLKQRQKDEKYAQEEKERVLADLRAKYNRIVSNNELRIKQLENFIERAPHNKGEIQFRLQEAKRRMNNARTDAHRRYAHVTEDMLLDIRDDPEPTNWYSVARNLVNDLEAALSKVDRDVSVYTAEIAALRGEE